MSDRDIVVNAQYSSRQAGMVTLASVGREWEHLYFIFERKCAVRLSGHFAGLFAGHIYV